MFYDTSPTILSSQMGRSYSHCVVLSVGTTTNISTGQSSLSGKWNEQSGINKIALVFNLQCTILSDALTLSFYAPLKRLLSFFNCHDILSNIDPVTKKSMQMLLGPRFLFVHKPCMKC